MTSLEKNVKALLIIGGRVVGTDLVIALAEHAEQMKCAEE